MTAPGTARLRALLEQACGLRIDEHGGRWTFSAPAAPVASGPTPGLPVRADPHDDTDDEPHGHPDGPALLLAPASGGEWDAPRALDVAFADDAAVPLPFRGRRLALRAALAGPGLVPRPGERVLASAGTRVLWTVDTRRPGAPCWRSSLALPPMAAPAGLADVFCAERFLELLPPMQALREAAGPARYRPPPLRACYIIDDPNLHRPRYGFVHYAELARSAQRHGYHVAFATIPLDGWFTHPATAALFRRNPASLSLLVHGNDHSKHELALDYAAAERHGLLRQALERIARLERGSGLAVARVMVPPHGACSSEMLAALAGSDFEALCVSTGSLRYCSPAAPWAATLGLAPGAVLEGCPVLPRWGFGPDAEHAMLLAAYLGQALVLRGHHRDLADGPALLEETTRFIAGLGDVRWTDMRGLARLNYDWRLDGNTCRVRAYGRCLDIEAPPGATRLLLEGDGPGAAAWQVAVRGAAMRRLRPGEAIEIDAARPGPIRVLRPGPVAANDAVRAAPARTTRRTRWPLVLRRLLAEGRDRLVASPLLTAGRRRPARGPEHP